MDSNVEKAYPGFCKINAELDMDGLPAYVDKAGGNRRVDSKILFNSIIWDNILHSSRLLTPPLTLVFKN